MATVLSGAGIGQKTTDRCRQAKCLVAFAIREQTYIRSDDRAAERHHDAAVKIDPKNVVFRVTRRVRHFCLSRLARLICQL